MLDKEKQELLDSLLKTVISDEHFEKVSKRIKRDNKRYEQIARDQYVSPERMRNTYFDI